MSLHDCGLDSLRCLRPKLSISKCRHLVRSESTAKNILTKIENDPTTTKSSIRSSKNYCNHQNNCNISIIYEWPPRCLDKTQSRKMYTTISSKQSEERWWDDSKCEIAQNCLSECRLGTVWGCERLFFIFFYFCFSLYFLHLLSAQR